MFIIVLNCLVQVGEIQSRCGSIMIESSGLGIGVGCSSAMATFERKDDRLLRDRSSARSFLIPATCMHLSSKLNLASMKKRHLARCFRWSCLLVRELSTATTAILSQWHVTCWPRHWCPHATEAMMMGIISFTAMGRLADGPSHRSWNHCLQYHAPQPHVPDASEANSGLGWAVQLVTAATPFHDCAN